MSVDELYIALSAQITQTVVNHQTLDWTDYFTQLRETIRRVVTDQANNSDLSADERIELTRQLLAHVDELEKAWPNLTQQ
jgi:hypothetical protein